ncbi:hypothetical protein [Metabacillus malikii]|nr:hypothetical protein [Metabacillus malikii]
MRKIFPGETRLHLSLRGKTKMRKSRSRNGLHKVYEAQTEKVQEQKWSS